MIHMPNANQFDVHLGTKLLAKILPAIGTVSVLGAMIAVYGLLMRSPQITIAGMTMLAAFPSTWVLLVTADASVTICKRLRGRQVSR